MKAFFDVSVLGLRIRVELPKDLGQDQRAQVQAAWSGALDTDDRSAEATVSLSEKVAFEVAMERLSVDVTLAALAALGDRALMFHAAGVADEQGRVAAFVGPSGRGKTTLSRALGSQYGYVSDETVAVGMDLSVSPYRKPLSLVREGAPKAQVSPAEAGLRGLPESSLSLGALVLLDRDAELDAPELVSVPLVTALPELVSQMSYLKEQKAPLQAIARLCDAVGGVQRLRYPDASTVSSLVPALIDRSSDPSEWQSLPTPFSGAPYDASGAVDAILTAGHVVVMVDSVVHVLDGVAPTIWLAAAEGQDIEGIIATVVAEYGAPPEGDSRALVTAALTELICAGILHHD